MPVNVDRLLAWASVAHLVIAAACLCALAITGSPILGVHPAGKPLKFALSIGVFLATLAIALPALSVSPAVRTALSWVLALTMAAEMAPIAIQALRGTTSHFNTATWFDAAAWRCMFVAILIATAAMVVIAAIATWRPLRAGDGAVMDPVLAFAWRAGLWSFLAAAASGFAMGGRGRHTIGAPDGGTGLAIANWSRSHGDLRVSHFVALHALQVLPLVGGCVLQLGLPTAARWAVVGLAIAVQAAVIAATLVQALAGRPVW